MTSPDRLFVPLARDPFDDFLERGKRVETRKYSPNFNMDTVFPGRKVELRLGYSGKLSLWGNVGLTVVGSLDEIFSVFDLRVTHPRFETIEEAIVDIERILGYSKYYLSFRIDNIH